MSAAAVKLSPALKELIAKPEARGAPPPAPEYTEMCAVLDAVKTGGAPAWWVVATAAVCAVGSPAALRQVYDYAGKDALWTMRETALACIQYCGVSATMGELTPGADSESSCGCSNAGNQQSKRAAGSRG
jgi:hypothetical protein